MTVTWGRTVDRWDALPRAVRLGTSIVWLLAVLFWVRVLPGLLFAEGSAGFWLVLVSAFVPIGLLLAGALGARRHRLGGGAEVGRMKQAMREGALPPDIDRDRWRRDLDDQARGARVSRRMQLTGVAAMAAVAGLTLLLGAVVIASGRGEPRTVAITMVVLVVMALAVGLLDWRVRGKMAARETRARELLDDLGG